MSLCVSALGILTIDLDGSKLNQKEGVQQDDLGFLCGSDLSGKDYFNV